MPPRKRDAVSLQLRLPPDLHATIKRWAEMDRRTINCEIIWLLDHGFARVVDMGLHTAEEEMT